jgi:glyceraldehyde-3-phosphate dehydrogenase/erythrose-4-phosphate dehydrogenase
VVVSAHRCYNWDWVVQNTPLVIDTANATRHVRSCDDKVVRIGAPSKL